MVSKMADVLKTKKRDYKYNGPVSSSDYNSRIEENYQDLVYLYNKANILDARLASAFERVLKDHIFLASAIQDLLDRVSSLESASSQLSIYSFSQIDYGSLVGTSYAVAGTELLSFDPIYNVITLPKVSSGSFSKLKFGESGIGQIVPDYFKARIDNSYPGVDTAGAIIDSTPIYNCILDSADKVWKRSIVSSTNPTTGAQLMLYVKIPSDSIGTLKTNVIKINPFPCFSSDIYSIEYTSDSNPSLTTADTWIPLNKNSYYDGVSSAIGKVAPGGWSSIGSDSILNSGALCFQFPETDVTAIRIKMNQRNYLLEGSQYVYTYGLSDLDVRYEKYLPTGRTIIKYSAPAGQTIEEVTNVAPIIYNVPESQLDEAFSYRIIYDDNGVYSLSNPGSNNHVWIEVTLNQLADKTAPVLSDLIIEYI